MKKYTYYILILVAVILVQTSCSDEKKDLLIPYPTDITFEDQSLGRFTFNIPGTTFKAGNEKTGIININSVKNADGSFSGFAVSNKNWRSYPWSLSPDFQPGTITNAQRQAAIDSTIFSVFTSRPNHTENYLVGRATGEDAFFSLEQPAVVEHVLVGNTSYNYLLNSYGSVYSGTLDANTQQYQITGTKVKNIQIANTSTDMYGRFNLPGPGNNNLIRLAGDEILSKRKAGQDAANAARAAGKTETVAKADSTAAYQALNKGYVKLLVTGYNNQNKTGTVSFWLAIRPGVDPANPTWNYIIGDWFKVDLTTLGTVTKLVFNVESSYKNSSGVDLNPPYFCLDGVRIKK